MESAATSPCLPGVPILRLEATGPEFSRWRRNIKFALETKGTWAYCNGACPMPMPAPNSSPSSKKSNELQPSLLGERRAWVRQDREVKLDIFLSLAEEVMQEVFEVGPPLPPPNCSAQDMMKALDERFEMFNFEAYHHAFCHFLNLHIDQHATIEDFNKEFSTVLEDLLDYGHPLSNIQACSAYFSKLRCTQNPWVAKKLKEWDAQASKPEISDLMQDSPPWSCIKPLTTKSSAIFDLYHPEPTPEEHPEGSSTYTRSDASLKLSNASTMSSKLSHSRQTSTDSQKMTVKPSNRTATGFDPQALREALEAIPNRLSPKPSISTGTESATPEWLSAKTINGPTIVPAPNRTLPALPSQTLQTPIIEPRARSASPHLPFETSSQLNLCIPTPLVRPRTADPTFTPPSHLQAEPTHPTHSPRTPTFPPPPLSDHPAFRTSSPSNPHRPTPPIKSPWRTIQPQQKQQEDQTPDGTSSLYTWSSSNSSSMLSLPIQGTHNSTWEDDKNNTNEEQDTTTSTSEHVHSNNPPIPIPIPLPTTTLPLAASLPLSPAPPQPHQPPKHTPTIPPPPPPPPPPTIPKSHRLSGDSLLESSSETREREEKRLKQRRAKGWSIGVNIARFTHSKGVREMI